MDFGDLYNYSTKNGVVIPNTDGIRDVVVQAVKDAFEDQTLSTDPETPQGRIIEAITLLFVDVLRVCAINANGFNPSQAVGTYLDNLGQLFGVSRLPNQSDANYRESQKSSYSDTSGYALAVRSALTRVSGVTSVCVLDNGSADPSVLPNADNGIAVSPHSVFICVGGGNNADIATAIFKTISAGCGFEHRRGYGVATAIPMSADGVPAEDGVPSVKTIYFYRPQTVTTSYTVTVRDDVYTGTDITTDTQNAIKAFLSDHSTNYTVTKADLISAISAAGTGIICADLHMYVGVNETNELAVRPYEAIGENPAITVTVI